MDNYFEEINQTLDLLIESEGDISEDLRKLIVKFKNEKADDSFPFGHLCIAHYKAYANEENKGILLVAAAIELLILVLDIVDDLQDFDSDASWVKEPQFTLNAILSMMIIVFKTVRECNFKYHQLAISLIETRLFESINGQQEDLLNSCREETTYLDMISLKSGSLVALSSEVGFVLATGKVDERVKNYSRYIGVVQQINNDIIGLKQDNHLKNDFIKRKFSLPIIYLMNSNHVLTNLAKYYYQGNSISLLEKEQLLNSLVDGGGITYSLTIRNIYATKARNLINSLNQESSFKKQILTYLE
ncbi:polyprenyl synthetase family protein [Solibacillus cecembensis]|uniref:polyprenyl synthetase family protein n=1 Tax=Solibacillus cecembensis TaxID=459347 RepID=UPI000716FAC8